MFVLVALLPFDERGGSSANPRKARNALRATCARFCFRRWDGGLLDVCFSVVPTQSEGTGVRPARLDDPREFVAIYIFRG